MRHPSKAVFGTVHKTASPAAVCWPTRQHLTGSDITAHRDNLLSFDKLVDTYWRSNVKHGRNVRLGDARKELRLLKQEGCL